MTDDAALRMLVMSALVMLVGWLARSASVRAVSVTLRSMLMPCEISDGAEIERHHQRQQHGEFDGRHAAAIAREARELPAKIEA